MKLILRGIIKLGAICIVCIPATFLRAADVDYALIVNVNNPIESISKDELKSYFLKQELKWKSTGIKVYPIDLPISDLLRRHFSENILGMKIQKVGSYWNKQMSKGVKKPKVIKKDKAIMLKIATFKGGIGYVNADLQLVSKVKRVTIE